MSTSPEARNPKSETRWARGLALVAAAIFCAALVASAPASILPAALGFDRAGVGYEGATGTLWRGEIGGLSVGGVPVGDVSYAFAPVSLLRGAAEARVAVKNGAARGGGYVSIAPDGVLRVRGLSADLDLAAFRTVRALGQPLSGAASARGLSLEITPGGRCRAAAGRVSTDAISVAAAAFNRKGFLMAGPLSCEGGEAVLALRGDGSGVSASVDVTLKPGWKIATAATLSGADAEMALALQTLGFRNDNGVWKTESGGISVGGS